MSAIAIIPARGGSKRLPRKNVLPVCGQPMVAWTIEAALQSKVFDQVIVSTDDDEIGAITEAAGGRYIKRPAEFATDTAHESLAYKHVLDTLKQEGFEPTYFCGIYATAALLLPEDLRGAYQMIEGKDVDVVMGVTAPSYHPYKALRKNDQGYLIMEFPDWCPRRSQEYPHFVASNGTLYFLRTQAFLADPTRPYYKEKLVGYEVPAERAIDVDTIDDLEVLQAFKQIELNKRRQAPKAA